MKRIARFAFVAFAVTSFVVQAQNTGKPLLALKDADDFTKWVLGTDWMVEVPPKLEVCGADGQGEKRTSSKISDLIPIPFQGEVWQLTLEVIGDSTARLMVRGERGPLVATYCFEYSRIPTRLKNLIAAEREYPGASVNRVWEYSVENGQLVFRGSERGALPFPLTVAQPTKAPEPTPQSAVPMMGGGGAGFHSVNSTPTYGWTRECGSVGHDSGNAADTLDGFVYVTGTAAGAMDGQPFAGRTDFILRKYSSSGVSQWTRLWGSTSADYGYGVAVQGSSVYVGGHAYASVGGQPYVALEDFCLTKYNTSGVQQWVRMRGASSRDYGRTVCVDSSGNVYLAGHLSRAVLDGQTNHVTGYDVCLIKYDSGGNWQWTRMWGSSGNEYVYGAAFDGEGAIYVAGITDGSFGGQTNQGNGDFFISKYDTGGHAVWHRIFGTPGEQMVYEDTGECLAVDPRGNLFITGSTGPAGGLYDYFLAKYSQDGAEEWRDGDGAATNSTFGFTVSVGPGGDAYVAGMTGGGFDGQPYSGPQKVFLLKYDAAGPRLWTRIWGSDSSSGGDFGIGSCVSTTGEIYVSGATRGSIDGQPYVGAEGYNDMYLSQWTDVLDVLPLEVISIAPKPGRRFVPIGTTLTKHDFNIVTDPPDGAGVVSVAPLSYPVAGVYRVVASFGSSAATTTVTALQSDSILNIDKPEDVPSVPMTNGAPVYTTTLSRISFDQLVLMADAQGSPFDPIYDLDWNDWSNAVEMAKKARSRGILDVLQGMDWADIKARIFDPVHVVNGSFYADEVDLRLAAPDPLEIRRSYSSENQAPSDLGVGWQLSCNYFLFVNNPVFDLATHVDLPPNAEVRVSEPDGTAVVYSRNASTPANVLLLNANALASDSNAPLNNVNANGIGGRANLLNNRVEYIPSNRSFYVYNGQGSIRRFDWQEFGTTNDPAYRKRPYLVYEQRPNGNRIRFTYTTNGLPATIRATDSTGDTIFNTVSFQYHADNKLWQLTASDGRTVRYYYDDFGDLSRVVRPDETEINYRYERFPISGTPTNYSTHRITRVQRPDHRILENEYFQIGETVGGEILTNGHYLVGRVKLQKVTQSSPSALMTNAWFSYSMVTKTGDPAAGSGFTEVYDALKNKTVYRFDTSRHITAIEHYAKARDTNGNPIMKGTHFTYLLFSTERRYWNSVHLVRTALENPSSNVVFNWGATYDDRGNLLSEKITGNLSGNFSGTLQFDTNGLPSNGESAATLYTYTYNAANTNDTQNLLTSILRPNGSVLRFVYASASNSSMTARYLCRPDGDTNALNNPIYSREFYEYNANQVLTQRITDDGTASNQTDLTGVTQRRIQETTPGTVIPTFGLPMTVSEKFYNGASDQTLLWRDLRYDLRGNPTNVLTYNSTNALQFSTAFSYDLMNQQTFAVDANGGQTTNTYDPNGNLTAIDGPLTNLTDTSTFAYDYANRLISMERRDGYGNILTNTFAYDEYGNELARTNLHGQVTRSYYDDLHRRTAIVLPTITTAESNHVAPTILFGFDLFDNITSLMDANSNRTIYTYNVRKQRTAAYYADHTQEKFTYDTAGRLVQSVAPNGSYTVYGYDFLDRVTNRTVFSETGALLARHSTAYNAFHVTAQTDANTNTTSFTHDGAGRLTFEYGPGPAATRAQTQYRYNDLSCVSECRVWFGTNATDYSATVYTYDNLGHALSETVQDSDATTLLKTEYGYDAAGNRTFVRTFPAATGNGATTLSEYDALNNLVSMTDALTNRTTIAYDYSGPGLKTTLTDPLTNKTVTIFDALGRETTVEHRDATNGLLRLTEYRYDPNGSRTRAIETVIGSHHTIAAGWTYDSRNRVSIMTEALGSADERTTRYFYNDVGQLYSRKNPNGVEVFHFYDSRGRVETLISGDNSIRYRYTYDANNNLLNVQDIVTGQTTTREFDENNRIKKETQATDFVLEYAYDRAGRPTRVLLPASNAVDYAYNAAFLTAVRRMTNIANLGAAGSLAYQHSYTRHDLAGNLLGVTLAGGQTQTFQTDPLNRRTLISGPAWTQTVSSGISGYDPVGNLKNFTVNDPGSVLNFIHTYDGLYQLASEAGVVSRTYAQDSIGNRLLLNRGATAYTYNHLNELLLQNASTSVLTGTIRVPVSGLYGPTKLSEAVSSVTLKLDGGNALSATVYTNGTWDYMNAGLKGLHVPVDGAPHTITVTATTTNHITNTKTVTVSYASTTLTSYSFDRNGNLLQQIAHSSNAAVYTYAYDALNRLVYITKAHPTASVVRVHYGYDPFDRLISQSVVVSSVTSLVQKFLWHRQSEIGVFDVSNNVMQLRVLGRGLGNEVGAAVAVELRTNATSALVAYLPIHDHRGNVIVLLHRATGAVAEYYRYDAFGNTQIYNPAHSLLPNSAVGNPWRFASKRADAETGFVYFGFRFYDPTAGRFVTADPLEFADGPNRYVYVGNRPLVFVDPDGRLAKGAGSGLDINLYCPNDPVSLTNPLGLQAAWFPSGPDVSPGTIFSYRFDVPAISSLSLPSLSDFRWHGLWGGPGWTAGQWKPESDLTPLDLTVGPIDARDRAYREHDVDICEGQHHSPFHDVRLGWHLLLVPPWQQGFWMTSRGMPMPAPMESLFWFTGLPGIIQ